MVSKEIIIIVIVALSLSMFSSFFLLLNKKMQILHNAFPGRIKRTHTFRFDFNAEFFKLSLDEKFWVMMPLYYRLKSLGDIGIKERKMLIIYAVICITSFFCLLIIPGQLHNFL